MTIGHTASEEHLRARVPSNPPSKPNALEMRTLHPRVLHLHPKLSEVPNHKPETFTVTQETCVTSKLSRRLHSTLVAPSTSI